MVSSPPSSRASTKSLKVDVKSETNLSSLREGGTVGHKPSRTWSVWSKDSDDTRITAAAGNSKAKTQEDKQAAVSRNVESAAIEGSSSRPNKNIETEPTPSSQVQDSEERTSAHGQEANNESKNSSWFFWGRRSNANEQVVENGNEERVVSSSASTNVMSNKIIPHSTSDAVLLKNKKDTEIAEEASSQLLSEQNPNIVVPSFDILPRQSTWASLGFTIGKIARSWHILSDGNVRQRCLYQRGPEETLHKISNGGQKPIRVLIVGVHGFFPTKMIRPFIGEPTGTSMKFVSEAEQVVLKYFQKHKRRIEISKIALEREGEVMDRVNFFFDVMKNWTKELNQADFIYFVAHSQGSPVTMLLLGQLIDNGIIKLENTSFFNAEDVPVSSNKKVISILAMAGINNGPFYGADQTLFVRAYQTIERESLRELFQFQKFDSNLSKQLLRSIRIIIGSGIKITFVGSINDQLVPLYSSTCLFVNHPNIFRATFIDRGSRTPAFITRLLNIAGSLLDLGYDDHGIIKEISSSLAGTLTGGGHSTVYNEAQVYELGIRFALETTDLQADVPVEFKPFKLEQLSSTPYHLPWCMRGLLYETNAHLEPAEVPCLFSEFEEWEPETKQLKDVKYRLNGLKSKL